MSYLFFFQNQHLVNHLDDKIRYICTLHLFPIYQGQPIDSIFDTSCEISDEILIAGYLGPTNVLKAQYTGIVYPDIQYTGYRISGYTIYRLSYIRIYNIQVIVYPDIQYTGYRISGYTIYRLSYIRIYNIQVIVYPDDNKTILFSLLLLTYCRSPSDVQR